MGKSVTDTGWNLQRTVSVKMTPGGVFKLGLLLGALGLGVVEMVGWILAGGLT